MKVKTLFSAIILLTSFLYVNASVSGLQLVISGKGHLPLVYEVTGGGMYCEGESGLPVGLSSSEEGVVYELFNGNITTNQFLSGNGSPLDFGPQPEGIYTITGTDESGTILMSGSATVTAAPTPIVSISADNEIYCHGTYATFTANLTFPGVVTYQWLRNNAPTGTNSPTLTLWAIDGDNISLRVTSAQGCTATSNTINLEVFINYAGVDLGIYEPIQMVAGVEITLETYTFNAGLNPIFEWFVNDELFPGNDCQLTYTPGPADEVYVRMIPGEEVPCVLDAYYSNSVKIYTCSGPPQAFDVWAETNTCGGELFSFGLSDTEIGVHYFILFKYEGSFLQTPFEFYGTGDPVEEYGVQSGNYYYLAVNACDSTWMNGHADLYPFDTRATISVSDNNICSGEEEVFSAKSNQPESVICTYNWVINGNWEWNPKPGDFNYIPVNGDIITAIMATPCFHDDLHFPDNNNILMMVNDCPGISTSWMGNVNENWHDPNNWDNGVPGSNTIVIIPGGRNYYPTITSTARCASIIIENGGSLIGAEFLQEQSALVKCNITNNEFHFLSSPVNPNPIFGEVFPTNQHTIWARRYYERHGEWINQTKYDQFEKAKGYSMQLTQSNTAHFFGKLNGENALTYIENYNSSGLEDRAGWNLLGNPFPSAIDWDLITHSNVENAVYVWNGTQYISWNGTVGALANGIIPPMNGFFVKMTVSNWQTFTIPVIARVHSNVPFYKEMPSDVLTLTVSGAKYSDQTFIHFNQKATPDFDPEFDARKLYGIDEAPQLFSFAKGKELSINEQPIQAGIEIEVGFKCGESGSYILDCGSLENFNNKVRVLLEDQKEGVIHDLLADNQYSFSYTAGESEHRFKLHFSDISANPESADINIYSSGKIVIINNFKGLKGDVYIYDFTGRIIMNSSMDKGSMQRFTPDVTAGPYIVKIITEEGNYSQKVVLM